MNKNSRLVYSTETGRIRADEAEQKDAIPEGDGIVRLMLDKKGRKGSGMTVITGLPLKKNDLKGLCKTLKKKCGVGGAVKEHNIEIQGDHRDQLLKLLTGMGYTVKKSGG